jgi:hypothetical protein
MVIREKPALFKALEDFEKTGKLITKTRMNFTIDSEISKKFREYCRKNNINMSKAVEDFMRKKAIR